jgi:secondary thiamine-phosphate synthase enzyme
MRIEEGICHLFVPHTTAGITINENADPSVGTDLLKEINKIVPFTERCTHLEGNSAAHIKASLIGASERVFY